MRIGTGATCHQCDGNGEIHHPPFHNVRMSGREQMRSGKSLTYLCVCVCNKMHGSNGCGVLRIAAGSTWHHNCDQPLLAILGLVFGRCPQRTPDFCQDCRVVHSANSKVKMH